MTASTKQGVALPREAHAEFKSCAERAGMSLSAWLVAAGRDQMLRESMKAYAEFIRQPEIAEQLAAFHAHNAPARAMIRAQVAAMGEAA